MNNLLFLELHGPFFFFFLHTNGIWSGKVHTDILIHFASSLYTVIVVILIHREPKLWKKKNQHLPLIQASWKHMKENLWDTRSILSLWALTTGTGWKRIDVCIPPPDSPSTCIPSPLSVAANLQQLWSVELSPSFQRINQQEDFPETSHFLCRLSFIFTSVANSTQVSLTPATKGRARGAAYLHQKPTWPRKLKACFSSQCGNDCSGIIHSLSHLRWQLPGMKAIFPMEFLAQIPSSVWGRPIRVPKLKLLLHSLMSSTTNYP